MPEVLVRLVAFGLATYVLYAYVASSGGLWSGLDVPTRVARIGVGLILFVIVEGSIEAAALQVEIGPRNALMLAALAVTATGFGWRQVRQWRNRPPTEGNQR